MLDTVKFKVPVTDKITDSIKFKGFTYEVKDNFYSFTSEKTTDKILIPPFGYEMNLISSYDPNYFYLEGSLPKAYFGENVHLLNPEKLPDILSIIYNQLVKRYDVFVSFDYWTIQRLDICYAWKFDNQQVAQDIVNFFKILRYPKKNYHEYKTSVMYSGRASTPKLYLKGPEFLKEDYKRIKNRGNLELAEDTLVSSNGVLRLEYEMRKAQLIQEFRDKELTYKDILDKNIYYKILNKVLDSLLGGINRDPMKLKQVLKNLEATFPKERVKKLIIFYFIKFSNNRFSRYLIKKYFNQSTISRYQDDFEEAKIGIPVEDDDLPKFNLAIPSLYEVKESKPPPALAGEV